MKSKLATIFLPAIFCIFIFSCKSPESPETIYGLKCEYQVNPVGVDRMHPLLQWKLEDSRRGAAQNAYQVIVSNSLKAVEKEQGNFWDSGKIESAQSVYIPYAGKGLESGKTYYWRVKVWDQDGKAAEWSEPASWQMGLLNPTDWQANWISRDLENPGRSAYMRKEINLPAKKIKKATVYVTGLGNYVFYINGKRVGKDLLTPGWTHYPKRLEYQVYDVSEFLTKGGNALGSVLGNMWWSGGLGWSGGQKYSEGPLKFLMQLEVEFEDGSNEIFITDDSWKWDNSPIVADHIYDGEKYDANLCQEGWDLTGFDDSDWEPVNLTEYQGKLSGPFAPALREHQTLSPVGLSEPLPGEYVFDMGQNMVGWAKFRCRAEKGDSIKLRFAELLHKDGTVAQENLRSAKATDVIISDGNEIIWEPKFTYHGFRYVQVSGLKEKPALEDLTGKVIYADVPLSGKFECSNELINQINKNVTWGQKGNFFAAPTDCPQRDERLGWMGDAQIFAPTANFNMQLPRFWAKWMTDITDGQDKEGWVYDVNPPIVVEGPSKPGWGDAVVIIPWLSYQYFGDTRIIEDNYDGMKAWVEYMKKKSKDLIYVWGQPGNEGWYGYGDWIAVEPTPSKPIGTAYFYYSTKLLSKMAKAIGKNADAEEYAKLASDIAEAYQREYWDENVENYPGASQTANLLPLAFGITPDELKPKVVENLVEDVLAHNVHPTTGFLGTGYILPMLSEFNHHSLAYEMMNKTDYPSWGYMVENGATTMWELWNSDSEPPEGMNSRNHFALGGVGEWIWNNLAGINYCENQPGFKQALIKPQPVEDLTWAKAEYETNYGILKIDWKLDGESFTLNLVVPPNSSALVELPEISKNAAVKENGAVVGGNNSEGLSFDENNRIMVPAGKYNFTIN